MSTTKQVDTKWIEAADSRLHAREPAEFVVQLVRQGRPIAKVQVVDMSQIGLGVEYSDVTLNCGQRVAVHFSKEGHPLSVSCCVPAVITHIGPKSVGLMLKYNPYY